MQLDQEVTDFEIESYSEASGVSDPLDLFSTSPTRYQDLCSFHRCRYNAPYFAIQRAKTRFKVVQGCCNHWDCPKCGIQVARAHYGRIVGGAREIAECNSLWFITVTCRGKEVTVEEAETKYLAWTSRFLDAAYASAKRNGQPWYYAQVTEKQKRGHPHSHILTTFDPTDAALSTKPDWKRDNTGRLVCTQIPAFRSAWMETAVVSSGLGSQYDISAVRQIEAASRYVAKYMFKEAQFQADYPKGWKRVRYSQSWPKREKQKTNAFVLMSKDDWVRLENTAAVIDAEAGDAFESAVWFLRGSDIVIHEIKQGEKNYGASDE